jgi:hypothetical protein
MLIRSIKCISTTKIIKLPDKFKRRIYFFKNYTVQRRRSTTHAHSPLWTHVRKPYLYEIMIRQCCVQQICVNYDLNRPDQSVVILIFSKKKSTRNDLCSAFVRPPSIHSQNLLPLVEAFAVAPAEEQQSCIASFWAKRMENCIKDSLFTVL